MGQKKGSRHTFPLGVFRLKLLVLCCAYLITGLLSACTFDHTEGNSRVSPTATAAIKKGITSKDQVRALLGDPQSTKTQRPVTQPPGVAPLSVKLTATEIWAFWTRSDRKPLLTLPFITAARPLHSSYTVFIFFDEHGVVLECQYEDEHT
jgi:hypothetical protein